MNSLNSELNELRMRRNSEYIIYGKMRVWRVRLRIKHGGKWVRKVNERKERHILCKLPGTDP